MTRHGWPDWDVYVRDRAACVYCGLDGRTAAVERLPADATLEDVIDSLLFLHKAQIGLGLSASLRTLVVCHCYRESEEVMRIISARKATRSERTQYNRRWES